MFTSRGLCRNRLYDAELYNTRPVQELGCTKLGCAELVPCRTRAVQSIAVQYSTEPVQELGSTKLGCAEIVPCRTKTVQS